MEIKDSVDSVTCRLCGEQCRRVYGKHLKFKHNNMSTEEYKKLFPGAPIMALSDRENTTKNSGLHMKTEKYKKMFSEKIKGEKNPNHKSNTTEDERKSRSPFSKKFIKYENIENIEEHISNFVKDSIKDRIHPTSIEYYLESGLNIEDAKEMLSERQRTFTIEKCIEKWGVEEGKRVFTQRQQKWQKSLLENGNLKIGYSKISQDLFNGLVSNISGDFRYATNGGEFTLKKVNGIGIWIYDFTDIENKKIIEYNGDQYHANPNIYKEEDTPHPFRKNIKSKDIWKKDNEKINNAELNGFEVLIIWDSEYKKNKNKTIKKCLKFLKN